MTKILGLDLGTNSIGWAVVETNDNKKFDLLHKGVHIFQEGVKKDQGKEVSKAEERTNFRSSRRLKFRRKLRKIDTLKVLRKNDYCPKLTDDEMNEWRFKKNYPKNENFRKWLLTDDSINKNPYYYRNLVVTEKLDLTKKENRYKIGRAFYHLAQRRGFLSNRLEITKESEGDIKKAISKLTEKKGNRTLGQYFYDLYTHGEKIRNHYTHREEHYLEEFNKICEFQQLDSNFTKEIQNAIFYQRPLKSQKGLIGKCPFETNKPRCASSHPLFEEYRMLCFLNNIKIKTPDDEKLRFLNEEERDKVKPLFFRKSKDYFDFEDIAKQLAKKKQYKYYKSNNKHPEDYLFNYAMKTTVKGCTLSARLESIFGKSWKELKIEYIREKDQKKSFIDINDVWHVLATFDQEDKLKEFAQKRLNLNDEQLKEFQKIKLKKEYAALSLKAIKKILPFLRDGLIYSHAVFLANMVNAIPKEVWDQEENKRIIQKEIYNIIKTQNQEKQIIEVVNGLIKTCKENNWYWSDQAENNFKEDIKKNIISVFGESKWNKFDNLMQQNIIDKAFAIFKQQLQVNRGKGEFAKIQTIDERVKQFITDHFEINNDSLERLYHPSAIEVYKPVKRGKDGKKYLGSPMVSSIKNPMAMRSLHQLRKLINELISQDIIDERTKINIEMSRDLKNANERKALKRWQNEREKLHKEYYKRILEHYRNEGIEREPTKTDILKYQLWEEQDHKCIYTGENIGISDFLGKNPSFDIEHTIPRSKSFDNSQKNKTLCQSRFNREIKRNKIPYVLSNHDEILERINKWKKKYEELNKLIQVQVRISSSAMTKDTKDNAIQKRHRIIAERDYWKGKYERFTMKDIPSGFKNSQLVDIGIITKYSRLYLKTVFFKVYTVKGNTVADFRVIWGLQNEYEKKARINHIHHCIDAITIACMTKDNYEALAKYYHELEDNFLSGNNKKPLVEKPWDTFVQDVKKVENEVFVSHYTSNNLSKQTKKKLRKRNGIIYKPIYKCDSKGNYLKDENGSKIFESWIYKKDINGNKIPVKGEKDSKNPDFRLIKFMVNDKINCLVLKPNERINSNIQNVIFDASYKFQINNKTKEVVCEREPVYSQGDTVRDSLHKQSFYGAIKRAIINNDGESEEKIYYIKRKPLEFSDDGFKSINEVEKIVDNSVKEKILEVIKEKGLKQALSEPIWMNEEKQIPIKKVRCYTPSVSNPIHLKKHRDKSKHEHKQSYHVVNDGNYLMAIYEGKDNKGKIKRDFEIVNNLQAGEYFKLSVQNELKAQDINNFEGLVPRVKTIKNIEAPLKQVIRIGNMVLLWEKSSEEVWELDIYERNKRLYKIISLSSLNIQKKYHYGTIELKFHNEAKQTSDLKVKKGVFKNGDQLYTNRMLYHSQFNALIEGIDFKINILGQIEKI